MDFRINPRKIGFILGIIAVYLAVQSIASEYLLQTKIVSESDTIPALLLDTLSVNAELTIPTWFSVAILLIAAALLLTIAATKRAHRDSSTIYWLGLGLIFLYLSIDEGVAIHEIFGDPLQQTFHTSGFLAFGWQIIAAPLVILFGLVYLRFLFRLPSRIRNLLIVAGVLYVGGALAGDAVGANLWDTSGGITLTYLAMGTVEELMEMVGVVVFIYALLSYIVDQQYILAFHGPAVTLPTSSAPLPDQGTILPPQPSSKLVRWLLWLRPTVLVILFLMGTNLALLYWVLTQHPTADTAATSALPFYHTIADQLQADGVTVVQMPGTFDSNNLPARQVVAALLSTYDRVMVVNLPSSQQSIAFAGSTLPFDQNSLSELLSANGESQFIVFDTPMVKLVAGNTSP